MRLLVLALLALGCGPIEQLTTSSYQCMMFGRGCHYYGEQGMTGAAGVDGTDGRAGVDGVDGVDGKDGQSCTAVQVSNGAVITCGDNIVMISNGINGLDGVDGEQGPAGRDGNDAPPTPYTVTELIDPCGDQPGFDEILLRLHNGQLIAHYAQGAKQFLTVIGPGNYVTTDGHACTFTVYSDLSVKW